MRAPSRTVTRARTLRRKLTLPEIVLWTALRRMRLDGFRFRRQHPLGPYILDFYCPEARLAIEVDGAAHDLPAQAAHDERRTAWLAEQGIRVPAPACRRRATGPRRRTRPAGHRGGVRSRRHM